MTLISRGLDQLETDVESVSEAQNFAALEVGSDLFLVNVLLEFIRKQHHDPVRLGGGLGHGQNLKPVGLGFLRRATALIQTDDDVDAAVLEVEGVGVALGAIANDRYGLAVQQTKIGVGVVKELGHPGRVCKAKQCKSLRRHRLIWLRLRLGEKSHGR